jgi:hypothetical protein
MPVPDRRCVAHPSSTPGATPTSICAAMAMTSHSPSSIGPPRRWSPSPLRLPSAGQPSHWRPSIRPSPPRRARARSTSASPQHLPTPMAPCRSPRYAAPAASAPPPCTSASPPSPTPAASSRLTKATVSLATDSGTTDNHNETRPSAEFPVPLPGIPTARGNGNWEVRPHRNRPHACPSNAVNTGPSNCVIALTAARSLTKVVGACGGFVGAGYIGEQWCGLAKVRLYVWPRPVCGVVLCLLSMLRFTLSSVPWHEFNFIGVDPVKIVCTAVQAPAPAPLLYLLNCVLRAS